ncbi:MAG: ABC transporter ATP-binding protein/permease [Armatimonadota bacterium]
MINLQKLRHAKAFGSQLWALVKPFWVSEERWPALGLLAVVVALNLGIVYLNVRFNEWYGVFYDALQNKNYAVYQRQLLVFTGLAFAFIIAAVYQIYVRQMLEIRWRRWLTGQYLRDWMSSRAFYRMELKDYGTDNPEQRIQEDMRLLTTNTLSLSLGLLSSVVTLVSFLSILWNLSGPLSFRLLGSAITIPGYMVWVAFVYAFIGSLLTHRIGWPLRIINFDQQRFEADFRYRMTRIRENAESIALYGGERDERQSLDGSFINIWQNWWKLMKRQKTLSWFTSFYGQAAVIFPFLVGAPRYFSGAIQLGGLIQISSAFGQVQSALSWLIDAYPQLADWRATVDRLTSFGAAIERSREDAAAKDAILVEQNGAPALEVRGLNLAVPTGRVLLKDVNERIEAGEQVLISGPSGSGKTTLFRALAGIWPFGRGTVRTPAGAKVLFLPQKPYLPLGTLKAAVCYPGPVDARSDGAVQEILDACRLGHLRDRLHESTNWSLALSGGEQQRLGFARILVNRPNWVYLDEATSAVDEETERHLYGLVRERLPGATVVSIAHRSTVAAFHQRRMRIDPDRQAITASAI